MAEVALARRTKLGTGKSDFLGDVDGRSEVARRYREISVELISDLGGETAISAAQLHLVKRVTTLALQAEIMEAGLASGEPLNVESYTKLSNTLNRLLLTLGIRRQMRDVTPLDSHSRAVIDGDDER